MSSLCLRRDFLKAMGLGAASLAFAGCSHVSESFGSGISKKRPNILFCLADDWSWPHASIAGDKVVKTPTFDRVARQACCS